MASQPYPMIGIPLYGGRIEVPLFHCLAQASNECTTLGWQALNKVKAVKEAGTKTRSKTETDWPASLTPTPRWTTNQCLMGRGPLILAAFQDFCEPVSTWPNG